MYASWITKLIVGIFALAGIAALAVLSLRLGRVELLSNTGYLLSANFDNISGLKTGDQVEISGVQVGKVVAISLSDDRAQVKMRINDSVKVDSDAIAAVKTSGIIGDKYVSISLGGGDPLGGGGTIHRTQSAFVLEDAIGQLINSSSSGSGGSSEANANNGSNNPGCAPANSEGSGEASKPVDHPGKTKRKR
jgi:phospholipid/cholesterol/gamma-HCH transport system substrate-binding protein